MTALNRVSYHWFVLAGSTLGLAVCHAPILLYTFAVFLKPLASEFGWQRGETALIITMMGAMLALVLPLLGRVVDRVGARRVLLPGLAGLGLVTMLLSILPGSLWVWYAVFLLLVPPAAAGASAMTHTRILTAWFDRRRGLALGVAVSGIGLGAAIFPSLAQAIMDAYSWRAAYLALGAIILVVGLPAVALLVRNTPEEMGLAPDHGTISQDDRSDKEEEQPGLSVKEVRREKSFWLIIITIILLGLALGGNIGHLSALFTDRGVDAQTAAAMVSVMGGASMIGRIVIGLLFDRFFAPRVAALVTVAAVIANLILASGVSDLTLGFISAAMLGLAIGAEVDLIGYLTGRYFGAKRLATIYGIFLGVFQITGGLGPALVGFAFDAYGSYTFALYATSSALAVACFLLMLLGPYPEFGRVGAQADPRPA